MCGIGSSPCIPVQHAVQFIFPIQKKYPWGRKNFLGSPSQKPKTDIPRHAILYVVEWTDHFKTGFLNQKNTPRRQTEFFFLSLSAWVFAIGNKPFPTIRRNKGNKNIANFFSFFYFLSRDMGIAAMRKCIRSMPKRKKKRRRWDCNTSTSPTSFSPQG